MQNHCTMYMDYFCHTHYFIFGTFSEMFISDLVFMKRYEYLIVFHTCAVSFMHVVYVYFAVIGGVYTTPVTGTVLGFCATQGDTAAVGMKFRIGLITFQFHPIIAGVIVYGIGTPKTRKLGDTTAPVFLHDSYEMFKCLQKVP